MNLRATLAFREMKAAVAGTQATHADPRSAEEWIKKFLDDKNKRLNDLRAKMHSLLDFPSPRDEYMRPEMRAVGTSEGVRKGWDKRQRKQVKETEPLIKDNGWMSPTGHYTENGYHESHMDTANALGYHAETPSKEEGLDKIFEDGYTRVVITTDTAYLQAYNKASFKNVVFELPRFVKNVVMETWNKTKGEFQTVRAGTSKEEAIDAIYSAYREDKKSAFDQNPRRVASGGPWAVVSPEDEIISTWKTKEEADAAAWPMYRGILSTGGAGNKVKRISAADIFEDEELGDKTRRKFLKHDKPSVVKLADRMRMGDMRPSSHGQGSAGTGGTGAGGAGGGGGL